MTNAGSAASAKILTNYRSYGEVKSNYWKKQSLHDAGTYAESGLGCCTKSANYTIDNDDIDRNQNELRASGQSNAKSQKPYSIRGNTLRFYMTYIV